MPILKADEPLPERPVVIALYGEPGSCKTTLGNTAEKVLVLDFDRGVSRSFHRQDTLIINSWQDILDEEKAGTFKQYKTVVIDTAKAALDDFLMSFVVGRDYKLKGNKLKAYGELGDEFKIFLNNRRNEGLDVIIIAHAKKDEDTKKSIPDVTGQSYQLILRVADQVGYVSFVNNDRNIQWTPTDLTVGKNTANLPTMKVPDKADPALKTFMADVITSVKSSIVNMSESQKEALEKSNAMQEMIAGCETPDQLTDALIEANTFPVHLKAPAIKLIQEKAKANNWIANKTTKRYEAAPAATPPATPAAAATKPADPAPAETPDEEEEFLKTSFDDRSKILGSLGMTMEIDQAVLKDVIVKYDELAGMTEEQFNDFVTKVNEARKPKKHTRATAA